MVYPVGITIDAARDLFVADRSAHEVIRIGPITGTQTVVSAGGNLRGPIGSGPNGIAIEAAGNLLVGSDRGGSSGSGIIVRVDPITGAQAVVSEGGGLSSLNAIAIDAAGNLLVANGFGSIIRVNSATGAQSVVSSGGNLVLPLGIAINVAGNIVTDRAPFPIGVGSILQVDPITGAQTIGSSGGSLRGPAGIAVVPVPQASSAVLCCIGVLAVCGCCNSKTLRPR